MTEFEALREEVAQLRKLAVELLARPVMYPVPITIPVPAPWPPYYLQPVPLPTYPYGPIYTTCGQHGAGNTAITFSN